MRRQEAGRLWGSQCLSVAALTLLLGITQRHLSINHTDVTAIWRQDLLIPWILVSGINGFTMVKGCFFSPSYSFAFSLTFLLSLVSGSLSKVVYISTNISHLLLFKVIGTYFVDFCGAVNVWKKNEESLLFFWNSRVDGDSYINRGISFIFRPTVWRKPIYLQRNTLPLTAHNICSIWQRSRSD